MYDALYNGTPVEITDEQSHRSKEMRYIEGSGIDGWVFLEDLDELPGTPPEAVALDEGHPPEKAAELREAHANE